jgi:Tol biopolymer transport system component
LTSNAADDDAPVFSPDGRYVAFTSTRTGSGDLYRRAADGSGDDELLFESNTRKVPTGFSPDGSLLLFNQSVPETGADMWSLPLKDPRTPVPVLVTWSLEGYASFSPDGKWIAYCSGEAGEGDQVYVSPYPTNGSRVPLSTAYRASPLWNATGRAVLFGTPDDWEP